MKRFTFLLIFTLITLFHATGQVELELVQITNAFDQPVDIANAGDERLFIVEKRGTIRIMSKDGTINESFFLDIRDQIADSGGERGLLGLAFHPDFENNGYFFINYTDDENDTQVSRFKVSDDDPDIADSESELEIINIEQPFGNHNGGCLKFGSDGFLYIGTGDGGNAGDPRDLAQDRLDLLGKMLRIDVNNSTAEQPYAVPSDNPFLGAATTRDEIWSIGLRNPWRYSFDRLTGDLWIGDVGQNAFEEIHRQPVSSTGGENYGWRCYEGDATFNLSGCGDISEYVFPVDAYPHSIGRSVTGGFVYRGEQYPDLQGRYLFADFVTGRIWMLTQEEDNNWQRTELLNTGSSWSTFGEDENGELYIADFSGTIYKITSSVTVNTFSQNNLGKLSVITNPFEDNLVVNIEPETFIDGSYSLTDQLGRVVAAQQLNIAQPTTVEVPTNTLPKGIYYFTVESNGKQVVRKVLKQ